MQERFLEGRTALVTGSVQGIGPAIGKALSSAGARSHETRFSLTPAAIYSRLTLIPAWCLHHQLSEAAYRIRVRIFQAMKPGRSASTGTNGNDVNVSNLV